MSRLARLVPAAVALTLLLAAPAAASPFQRSVLQDDARVIHSGSAMREATLDEIAALGADTLKITIPWRGLAPSGRSRPRGFAPEDPRAYEGFGPYDEAVTGAHRRGLEVFLQVSGPAPDWASGGRSEPEGAVRPDPEQFGAFARAVGTRYSGGFSGLPRVSLWSIWNEPNLPRFLLPQRSADQARTPVSPHLYRRLYVAAHDGLTAAGHGDSRILLGELLPIGRNPTSSRSSIRPLEFLREMACVDRRFRPYRGSAARERGCSGFRRMPAGGVAHHPYTPPGGPRIRPRHPDDVTVGVLARLVRTMDRLGRAGRLPRGMELFLTEFGYQSDPPDSFASPLRRVPAFLAESEYVAFRSSRVASVSQYPLVDDALKGEGLARFGGFQSGLRFADGRVKPGIYDAYRRPFFVRLLSPSRVEIFGGVRTADGSATPVVVEERLGSRAFRTIRTARLGPRGYFRAVVRVSSASRRSFRFRHGEATSRTVRAARR
jgi:hypothetical protein